MHRTEGPDYITESGKRRYKETPSPGTVVNKFAMNSIQEEICLAVENSGLTLNATGAADRTAGWGQLWLAMLRVHNNLLAYGADPTGSADSAPALTAALAANPYVYVPLGTFRLATVPTIPNFCHIYGGGEGSYFNIDVADAFKITDQHILIDNVHIQGNTYKAFQTEFDSADPNVILTRVTLQSSGVALTLKTDGTLKRGSIYMNQVKIASGGVGSVGMEINNSTYPCKMIRMSQIECIQATATAHNFKMYGNITNGGGDVIIQNSSLSGGLFYWKDDTDRIFIKDSYINAAEHQFENTSGGGYENCIIGGLSNTISNNYNTTSSRTFWRNVRDDDGKINGENNINGIQATRYRGTSNQTISGSSTDTKIDFNTSDGIKMARNSSYTKDDPWDNTNKWFMTIGYGDGYVHAQGVISIECDTQTLAEISKVRCKLRIANRTYYIPSEIISISATGILRFSFDYTEAMVPGVSRVYIDIDNNRTGYIDVIFDSDTAFIKVNGL